EIYYKRDPTGNPIEIQNISTEIPSKYSLSQNYPNPFNPTTVISFQLSVVGQVVLKVYDVMGCEVQTLVKESLKPGTYEASFDGSQLTSGVYFYKISAGDFSETKKMLLIK
ncbi:MAG TPA: T9SS type A sorting domain-containing protein, partial [Ignavibacteria bacterium]